MKTIAAAGILGGLSGNGAARTSGPMAAIEQTNSSPATRVRFEVELELSGGNLGGWTEVELPDVSTQEGNFRTGNSRPSDVGNQWGRTEYENLTLRRPVEGGLNVVWDWRQQVIDGKIEEAKKNIAVSLLDTTGQEPVARYEFTGAWPVEYSPPTLDATAGRGEEAIAMESVTCVFDDYQRTA